MQALISILLWVVIIGVVIYQVFIKKGNNRKAAQSGEDKQRVRRAVEPLLGEAADFRLVYAHWEEQESYARMVKTTYYRYAVAFQSETLWVFPLGIDKKTREIRAGEPMAFTAAKLGKITLKTKEKDGAVERLEVGLCDKKGHAVIQLFVDAENLRKNRWFPVNILQQEECEAFKRFLDLLARRVASENPGVDAMLEEEAREGLGMLGAGISILGAVLGFFLAPLGAVLCLLGLILSLVAKAKGTKSKKSLIISVICMLWMALFNWFLYTYTFV